MVQNKCQEVLVKSCKLTMQLLCLQKFAQNALLVSHIPSHISVRVNSGAIINITHNSRTAEMVNGCMDDGIDGGVDGGCGYEWMEWSGWSGVDGVDLVLCQTLNSNLKLIFCCQFTCPLYALNFVLLRIFVYFVGIFL